MEREDKNYITFVLGYDLLKNKLNNCEKQECDLVFDTLNEITNLFLVSGEIKNYTLSLYDSLREFINNNEMAINILLFNKLNYKI